MATWWLTPAGRATLHAIQAEQRPWADGYGPAVGERRLNDLNAGLDRAIAALSSGRSR
jgi:hypothetical protein